MGNSKSEKILFVCTGNSCRSVMAEGYFNKRALESKLEARAESAGVSPLEGMRPTDQACRVLARENINMDGHLARRIDIDMVNRASNIYAMDEFHKSYILQKFPNAKGKVKLLRPYNIIDPIGKPLEVYERIFEEIREGAERIICELQ